MKRYSLLIALILAAVTVPASVPALSARNRSQRNDEQSLKKLLRDRAMCAVGNDSEGMAQLMTETFKGAAGCISFDKHTLKVALESGEMRVGAWTIDDVSISINGNDAVATGRWTLSNATFLGKDLSGKWVFKDCFVRQKDGNWRASSSESKRMRQLAPEQEPGLSIANSTSTSRDVTGLQGR